MPVEAKQPFLKKSAFLQNGQLLMNRRRRRQRVKRSEDLVLETWEEEQLEV